MILKSSRTTASLYYAFELSSLCMKYPNMTSVKDPQRDRRFWDNAGPAPWIGLGIRAGLQLGVGVGNYGVHVGNVEGAMAGRVYATLAAMAMSRDRN
jgi:hypothetical protein